MKMLFPVIEVMDRGNKGQRHIVGTSPHDCLTIEKSGLIGYYNLQNGEGTNGDYAFVGNSSIGAGIATVNFVNFDILTKIYKEQYKAEEEVRETLRKMARDFLKSDLRD